MTTRDTLRPYTPPARPYVPANRRRWNARDLAITAVSFGPVLALLGYLLGAGFTVRGYCASGACRPAPAATGMERVDHYYAAIGWTETLYQPIFGFLTCVCLLGPLFGAATALNRTDTDPWDGHRARWHLGGLAVLLVLLLAAGFVFDPEITYVTNIAE